MRTQYRSSYVENLPPTATKFEGVSLKIPIDLLQLDFVDFTDRDDIAEEALLCSLIEEFQPRAGNFSEITLQRFLQLTSGGTSDLL